LVVNNTALDARHTNVALEARKAGYEPALFGYTDIGSDPRVDHQLPAGEENHLVLPGMDPVSLLGGDFGPWLDYLEGKGYERPDPPQSAFEHSSGGRQRADRGLTFPNRPGSRQRTARSLF
jgi:arylsulfatase A-like enzyme